MENINIEEYPIWCNDDIDKLIHRIIISSKKEPTFTQLKNQIYDFLIDKFGGDKLIDRLSRLEKLGIIESKPKETNIKIWKAKDTQLNKQEVK